MRESAITNVYQMTTCVGHRNLFQRTRRINRNASRIGKDVFPSVSLAYICKTVSAPGLWVILPVPPCHDPCVQEPWNLIVRQTFSSECCHYFLEWQLAQSGTPGQKYTFEICHRQGRDAEERTLVWAGFFFFLHSLQWREDLHPLRAKTVLSFVLFTSCCSIWPS